MVDSIAWGGNQIFLHLDFFSGDKIKDVYCREVSFLKDL